MSPKSLSAKATKITDVAQWAGVSVTTVSMVLNGKGRISPATAERVQQAIRALDYVPNSAAANLRSQQSNPGRVDPCGHHRPLLYRGDRRGERGAGAAGLSAVSDPVRPQPRAVAAEHPVPVTPGVAGIIFNPVRGAAAKPLEHLLDSALPLVCAARSYYRDDVDFIGPDNTHAAQQATTYLIEQGHRHIAYVGGRADSSPAPSASAATAPACCNTACPSNPSGYWSANAPSAAPPTPSPSCCTGTPR